MDRRRDRGHARARAGRRHDLRPRDALGDRPADGWAGRHAALDGPRGEILDFLFVGTAKPETRAQQTLGGEIVVVQVLSLRLMHAWSGDLNDTRYGLGLQSPPRRSWGGRFDLAAESDSSARRYAVSGWVQL